MSEFRVDTITDRAGTGRPNFPNGLNIAGNNVISNSPAWSESGTAPTSLATENRIIAYNKGGKNLLINGNMMIHQRVSANTPVSVTTEGYFTADRWITEDTMDTAVFSQTIIDTDSPPTLGGQEFRKVLRMTCTTAKATSSLAPADAVKLVQRIEGQNLQVLKKGTSSAESITVSFWVKSNISATYIVELDDVQNSRQISKSYTTTANTWTKQVLTFVGDTGGSGTLNNDSSSRLKISFWLVAGSTFTNGSLNSNDWQSYVNGNRAVGQTNFASANTNTFFITGIQMEVGSIANPFEYKSYSEQLSLCQRYYQVFSKPVARGVASTTTQINRMGQLLHIPMRIAPNLSMTGFIDIYDGLSVSNITSFANFWSTTSSIEFDANLNSGTVTTGRPVMTFNGNNTGSLIASAEL